MAVTVDLTPLTQLATELVELDGVRAASVDPAELTTLPAVWVQLTGIRYDLLGGHTLATRLVLVVPDNGVARSGAALLELLNKVTDVVEPDGDVTPYPVSLPGQPNTLPGLAVPVDLMVANS